MFMQGISDRVLFVCVNENLQESLRRWMVCGYRIQISEGLPSLIQHTSLRTASAGQGKNMDEFFKFRYDGVIKG